MMTQAPSYSHRCRHCQHGYTPAVTEPEDCPLCGSDGRALTRTLNSARLLHHIVMPLSSAAGHVGNALDGLYGDLAHEQQHLLREADVALDTALACVRKALESDNRKDPTP